MFPKSVSILQLLKHISTIAISGMAKYGYFTNIFLPFLI